MSLVWRHHHFIIGPFFGSLLPSLQARRPTKPPCTRLVSSCLGPNCLIPCTETTLPLSGADPTHECQLNPTSSAWMCPDQGRAASYNSCPGFSGRANRSAFPAGAGFPLLCRDRPVPGSRAMTAPESFGPPPDSAEIRLSNGRLDDARRPAPGPVLGTGSPGVVPGDSWRGRCTPLAPRRPSRQARFPRGAGILCKTWSMGMSDVMCQVSRGVARLPKIEGGADLLPYCISYVKKLPNVISWKLR